MSARARKSGDIYTATDLGLMASVAARCGEVIERIDLETLARESQVMQSALRRYVPGAVADRVLAGDALLCSALRRLERRRSSRPSRRRAGSSTRCRSSSPWASASRPARRLSAASGPRTG